MAEHTLKHAATLDEYVAGNADRNGEVIDKVFTRGKSCVIYETPTALRVEIDSNAGQTNLNYFQILPSLTRVRNLQAGRFGNSESLKFEIARAVLVALNGKLDDAKEMFDHQRQRLIALHNLHCRLEYLGAGVAVALLLGIGVAVAGLFHSPPASPPASPALDALLLLKVAWAGTIGGVMSVYLGIRKVEMQTESTRLLNVIVGASRIVFAFCAAMLAYFAIASIALLFGLNPAGNEPAMFTLGIAAGFSERWAPGLMYALQPRATADPEPKYSITRAPDANLLPPSAPGM
ncbi:MAG: hypothetical protein ACHQZQ_03260 [SAR324 cluster bacterium]